MANELHILKTEPDETIVDLIDALSGDQGVAVVGLYEDKISGKPMNWHRLVDDIFSYERVICWW